MATWVPYLSLLIFPFVIFVPFNPLRFMWGYRHDFEPVPEELKEKFEQIDRRVTYPFRNALLLALIITLAYHEHISAKRLGLNWHQWEINTAIGICSGVLRVVYLGLAWSSIPVKSNFRFSADHVRGPVPSWILLFLLGAFSEELWWALCIVTFMQTNHSAGLAIVLAAIAFGLAHYPNRMGAVATACIGAFSGMLFVWRGSLIPSFLLHFIGNLGVLYWDRRMHRMTR
jgi:membrane protease YdiL (CAAX protease family)